MAFLTDLRNLAGNRAEEGGGHTHPATDQNGEPGRDLAEAGAHTRARHADRRGVAVEPSARVIKFKRDSALASIFTLVSMNCSRHTSTQIMCVSFHC